MGIGATGRIDDLIGDTVERAVLGHHRRRLKRIGRLSQLEPPRGDALWAAGDPPVRDGNAVEVLIDGAQTLSRISAELEGARSSIDIAAWHLTPEFGLTRGGGARRLRDQLAELAENVEVRVLLWAGSPLPLFKPDRGEVRECLRELTRGSRVRCELDARERPLHCHHEKLVIVDRSTAFVGGIDLTSLGGDRFDTSDHPARGHLGWHDAATMVRGPAVGDVAAHFAMRWQQTSGEELPADATPAPCGDVRAQIVRTVPERLYDPLPQGDFRIAESYLRALRSARELVYIESQFLWSPELVNEIAAKLRDPPSDRFRVVVLLPARPNNGADDTRGQLAALVRADGGRKRLLATTVSSRTAGLSEPLYVHAKIGIVDDRWMTVGSANLNEHSLFNDTEMNVVTCDPALVRDTRLRLWAEHLELPMGRVDGPPATVVDELWRPLAVEQRERMERGEPVSHRLRELPGISRRSRALLGPIDSLVVDG